MFNIFKKKKKNDPVSMLIDNEEIVIDVLENHTKMIGVLRENDEIIKDIVINQQKAIRDLQNQMKTLQELIDQNEGV